MHVGASSLTPMAVANVGSIRHAGFDRGFRFRGLNPSFALLRHFLRHADRRHQACGARLAGAGEIVGGAVIDGGADDRQAEGDIDAVLEMQQLERDQPLIVVHADDRIVIPARGEVKEGVGAVRAAGGDPLRLAPVDGRCDQPRFLIAEEPPFAGVRIEGEDGDFRLRPAEKAAQGGIGDADRWPGFPPR